MRLGWSTWCRTERPLRFDPARSASPQGGRDIRKAAKPPTAVQSLRAYPRWLSFIALVGRSGAERPGPTRRGLSVPHPVDRPSPKLRRQIFNLHSMFSAPGRRLSAYTGTGHGDPRIAGNLTQRGQVEPPKRLLFGPCTARFSFRKKEKWGVHSRAAKRRTPRPGPLAGTKRKTRQRDGEDLCAPPSW